MKKLLLFFLAVCMIFGSLSVISFGAENGMTFLQTTLYRSTNNITTPRTIEAWIYVDPSTPNDVRPGIVVGNYSENSKYNFGLEIVEGCLPAVWWNVNGVSKKVTFTGTNGNTNLRRFNGKVHVAVTIDQNRVTLYLNGGEAQRRTFTDQSEYYEFSDLTGMTDAVAIGGDFRNGNGTYLKYTTVYSVELYSNVRTAAQINSDKDSINYSESTLLCAYDLTKTGNERLKDYSNNANHLVYTNTEANTSETYGQAEKDDSYTGLTFEPDVTYQSEKPLSAVANTYEAMIYFPQTTASSVRGGVVVGNYSGVENVCVSMEIYTNGNPRLYWEISKDHPAESYVFSNVNVYNGKWTHLTIVRDVSKMEVRCYVDGVLKQTLSMKTSKTEAKHLMPICLGGDLRGGNSRYFLGKINSVALYSDVRTDAEILSDSKATTFDKSGLVAGYDLTKITQSGSKKLISDQSGNGNDAIRKAIWLENNSLSNYAYSFAVVGDTQKVAINDIQKGTQYIAKMYDYIVSNISKQNIKCVIGLGDITDKDYDEEWSLLKTNISKMDGKVSYILNRGNHDSASKMDAAFKNTPYYTQLEGTYDGSTANSYFTLTVGGIKYLIMALDYGASDAVLNWAGNVISSHSDHNVIISTHAYLFHDGTTLDDGDACPPSELGPTYNDGDDMWEKLIRKHKNIVLVLSGHDPWNDIVMRSDKGDNDNNVVQMLIDPQGMDISEPLGMIAMFHFSSDGKTVQVEYYSAVKEAYYEERNQFTFTLDVVKQSSEQQTTPESTTTSSTTTEGSVTTPENTTTDSNTTPSTTTESDDTSEVITGTSNVDSSVDTSSGVTTEGVTTSEDNAPQKNNNQLIIIIAASAIIAAIIITAIIFIVLDKKK